MPLTITPTQDQIQVVLRNFLLGILPSGVEVFQGQDNRVPEPQGEDFVVMTAIRRERIETNVDIYNDVLPSGNNTYTQNTKIIMQLDVHGPNSSDNAQIISTMFRDPYAVDAFNGSGFVIAPLYADDPRQTPFINAEEQYEYRWTVEAEIQANQVISGVPQQFAAQLGPVNLIDVDATYPPE